MIWVSILIATYNGVDHIKATINSCLAQTYTDFELLIIDDQSSDGTRTLIQTISDPRIRLFRTEINQWPYKSLNILLDHAKGRYIAIQDHDDIRHCDKIKTQIDFLDTNSQYIWCGTQTLMYYESDSTWFEYSLSWHYAIHPSLVFRAWNYRYPDTVYMNDALFQKAILCKWKKLISTIDQTLTLHRIKSWSTNYSYKRFMINKKNIHTIFQIHSLWYGCMVLVREIMRKIVYPVLIQIWCSRYIDRIERIPFTVYGQTIQKYDNLKLTSMWFIIKISI